MRPWPAYVFDQVLDVNICFLDFWVQLVSMNYRGDILPSWSGLAGMLAGFLMLLLHVILLSGIGSIRGTIAYLDSSRRDSITSVWLLTRMTLCLDS